MYSGAVVTIQQVKAVGEFCQLLDGIRTWAHLELMHVLFSYRNL